MYTIQMELSNKDVLLWKRGNIRLFDSIMRITPSGGRIPRGVTRLSFRRKKKLSLFGKRKACRVDSKTDLMENEDAGKQFC